MTAAARVREHNIEIPESSAPAAAYVPYTVAGNVVYVSGQLPFQNGALFKTGIVGKDVTLEDAKKTAEVCALNVLAHIKHACGGDLNKVKKVLKLEILVAASQDFIQPHVVANGASELIIKVFGEEIGKHARVAYGVAVLPMNVPVEVAATIAIG